MYARFDRATCAWLVVLVAVLYVFGCLVIFRAYTRPFSIGAETYRLHSIVGSGTEGTVYRGVRVKDGSLVALKHNRKRVRKACDEELGRYVPEHPNLMQILDTGNDSITGAKWVVMSYHMETGLDRVLAVQTLDACSIRTLFRDIGQGLAALHEKRLIHRDVIPRNVLVNVHETRACVCDYGMMRRMSIDGWFPDASITRHCEYDRVPLHSKRTPKATSKPRPSRAHVLVAPEELDPSAVRTQTVDTWMWGCTFVYMVTKRMPPYPDQKQSSKRIEIRRTFVESRAWETWPEWSERFPRSHTLLFDLLRHVFVMDPDERWTVQQCLEHPWFQTRAFP